MSHLSAMALDALRLGALPAREAAEARAHLGACEECAAREARLSADTLAAAQGLDFAALAASAEASARAKARWWRRGAAAGLALAASVALFVVLPRGDTTRTKGGGTPSLALYAVRGEQIEPLAQGEASPGMRLRLHYDPAGKRWLRLLWSAHGQLPAALAPPVSEPALDTGGAPGWLPREIDVDSDASSDVLYGVLCDDPVTHADALGQLSGTTRDDCTQVIAPLGRGKAP